MQLSALLPRFQKHPQVKALTRLIDERHPSVFCEGMHASAAPVCFAAAAMQTGRKCVYMVVLNDEEEAGYFYHDLLQLVGEEHALFLPSGYRRAVKYGQRDAANEILRTDVISRLSSYAGDSPLFVVSFPTALAERVASGETLKENTIEIAEGKEYDVTELTNRLKDLGFHRRDYVYEPGEYAVRGSIVDIFSFSGELPYRLDFFGDEVDSIRTFEVQTQLSKERKKVVKIVPEIEKTSSNLVPFPALLPAGSCLLTRDFFFIGERIDATYNEGFAEQAIIEREATSEMDAAEIRKRFRSEFILANGAAVLRELSRCQRLEFGNKPSTTPNAIVHFDIKIQPLFHKNFDLLRATLGQLKADGYDLHILADSEKQTERLHSIFEDMEKALTFTPILHTLHEGFIDETLRIVLFTDHQIFDRFHKYNLKSDRARNGKLALTLKELMQFEPGDYVVHVDHGVGQFAGLVRMPGANGEQQELIKLVYKNDDVVFVSIHSLHKVSKYKGKEGEPPRLSHLGTGAWEKLKDRTKKKIKDIARDLIRLYAQRKEQQGFAFSADSFMQQELEASFAYEDTPDQLKVTQEVKADMEQQRPMDRLVCGDVGFGKTEIAIRAAMKAAADNKQVAVLVPTTVLALQHYKTFAKRLKDFPIKVDYLSRARTTKQTNEILRELEAGNINIIIGTHKLVSKAVKFKDLGLLIIDEEQKFGVSVKEKLRQIKVNIDTLTMSATPIPRTLQFSLMGARDFSTIQTPPPNRHPIQTEIHSFNGEVIGDAVNFEMSRNGQVYFVTHRISQLPHLKAIVEKYVPDARVAIGHGQMPPAELEKIILDFVNYDYDVLISTTIVESGIDIPNANTIIIDNAHHFGLSDLHQMRGRVGRSNRKAFCYLLAPPLSALPDDARRRLQAIENFSDLGSGIHIAMQDLDIRGAGNLLGAEQSGFIADLGYETYQKILAQAVSELKNEEFAELYATENGVKSEPNIDAAQFVDECSIECDLRAYFPETYVPGSSERMLLYRELDGISNEQQLEAFRQRMFDRFGPLPLEGEELLRIQPLRRLGKQLGVERITLKNGRMTLYFVSNPKSMYYQSETFGNVLTYAVHHLKRCKLDERNGRRSLTLYEVPNVKAALALVKEILEPLV